VSKSLRFACPYGTVRRFGGSATPPSRGTTSDRCHSSKWFPWDFDEPRRSATEAADERNRFLLLRVVGSQTGHQVSSGGDFRYSVYLPIGNGQKRIWFDARSTACRLRSRRKWQISAGLTVCYECSGETQFVISGGGARDVLMMNRGSDGRCRTTQATLAVRTAATDHARRVLPIIIELRCAGVFSLGQIASELRRRDVRTARGGQWHPMTVARLLARRNTAGCPMPLPEMRAVHRNNVVKHARKVISLAQALVRKGFNTTEKLRQELNRQNKLTFSGLQW
jgi:hypothetical protein